MTNTENFSIFNSSFPGKSAMATLQRRSMLAHLRMADMLTHDNKNYKVWGEIKTPHNETLTGKRSG